MSEIALTVTEQVVAITETGSTTVEIAITETPISLSVAAGVTDHGQLEGLEDDDHPQYLLRTDYVPGGDADTLEGHAASYFEVAGAASSAVAAHVAAANPHSQYLLVANYAPGISRIQDASDFSGSLTNGYVPTWSSAQSKFVMSAQAGGAPGGSTTQVQYNTSGSFSGNYGFTYNGAGIVTVGTALVSPDIRSVSNAVNSTGFSKADGTRVFSVDTTNSRVGIGVTNPGQILDVNGNIVLSGTVTRVIYGPQSSGVDLEVSSNQNLNLYAMSYTPLRLFKGIPPYNTSGNVEGVNFNIGGADDADLGFFVDRTNSTTWRARGSGSNANPTIIRSSSGNLIFYADTGKADLGSYTPTERMRITSVGNVGIGTTSPNNTLDVAGTVQMDGLRIDVTPTAKTITCTHTITFSANGTNYEIPCAAA